MNCQFDGVLGRFCYTNQCNTITTTGETRVTRRVNPESFICGSIAAMTGLDPEASSPPDSRASPRACRRAPSERHTYHCNCRPIAESAPKHQETAMRFLDRGRSRFRQPKVLPSSASRRWYPGNLGPDRTSSHMLSQVSEGALPSRDCRRTGRSALNSASKPRSSP